MTPTVTVTSRGLIRPCAPTPPGTLPLSSLDKHPPHRVWIDLLFVYKDGPTDPATVIRAALSRALVHYYPLAGRLVESAAGDVEVACTAAGVWFVEASADHCSLQDVNYMERPHRIAADHILPLPRPGIDLDDGILMMQVTKFICGGFAVTVAFNHVVFDGLGVYQFLGAVGEMARGLERPSVDPVWSRDALAIQLSQSPPPPPPYSVVAHCPMIYLESQFDIPLDTINQLKSQYKEDTGRSCSTFDVIAARFWQCRTRAIGLHVDEEAKLVFPMNVRPLLIRQAKGHGYYGNCVFPASATARSGAIADPSTPTNAIVDLIHDAKKRVPCELDKWAKGELKEEPFTSHGTVLLNDVSDLGGSEVDYRWGFPKYNSMVSIGFWFPFCIMTKSPVPMRGVRLETTCVQSEEQLTAFRRAMLGDQQYDQPSPRL